MVNVKAIALFIAGLVLGAVVVGTDLFDEAGQAKASSSAWRCENCK